MPRKKDVTGARGRAAYRNQEVLDLTSIGRVIAGPQFVLFPVVVVVVVVVVVWSCVGKMCPAVSAPRVVSVQPSFDIFSSKFHFRSIFVFWKNVEVKPDFIIWRHSIANPSISIFKFVPCFVLSFYVRGNE